MDPFKTLKMLFNLTFCGNTVVDFFTLAGLVMLIGGFYTFHPGVAIGATGACIVYIADKGWNNIIQLKGMNMMTQAAQAQKQAAAKKGGNPDGQIKDRVNHMYL